MDVEPCISQTLTTDLPEAIHKGTRNWTTGELTVMHERKVLRVVMPPPAWT